MECPNCKHQAASAALVKCSECGWAFERQHLEEYEHINYLQRWLDAHKAQIGEEQVNAFLAQINSRGNELENLMHLHAASPKPAEPVVPAALPLPPKTEAVPATAPQVVAAVVSPPTPAPPLKPAPLPVPPAAPKPVSPPQPAQPPINWSKIWDNTVNFVVSGALLRALLYMGAFMIVVSAAVLVISFWNIFPPILQFVFIFALPTAFYAGGWFTRARLKLDQAGMVITGIGAVLLAVDFAALYQLANLRLDVNLYWLVAALITTIIYIFTAHRLSGEFFDFIMFLGAINILLALTRVLHLGLEWTLATIPLSGAGMVALAVRFWPRGEAWRDTARASRYLPQVLMPISLAAILFVSAPHSAAGKMTAFLFAAVAYILLAWKFPSAWQLAFSLVSLSVAACFAVLIFDSAQWWLPTAGALLSAGYISAGWSFFNVRSGFPQKKTYRRILYLAGFGLSLVVLLGGFAALALAHNQQAAIALTILALSFCAWNLLLGQPEFGFIGALLLLPVHWVWLDLAHLQKEFFPLAFLGLISLVHLPAGILLRRLQDKFARPFRLVGWGASFLTLIGAFWFQSTTRLWLAPLTISLLAVYYIFNTWYFSLPIFSWVAVSVVSLAVGQWIGFWKPPTVQAALVWVGCAYVFVFMERLLNRQKLNLAYRLPLGLAAIVLTLIGLTAGLVAFWEASPPRDPLTLVTPALVFLFTILAARLYRSRWPLFVEPPVATLLAVLFFIEYGHRLFGRDLSLSQFGLVLCAIGWVHLLVAAALDRLPARYSHGLYLGGYGLVSLSVFLTLVDLPGLANLLWTLGAFILSMCASFALVYLNRHQTWDDLTRLFGEPGTSFVRLLQSAFLWLAAWLTPIWCVLLLVYLKVPDVFYWLGFSLPPLFYLFAGTQLARRDSIYSLPVFSAAHVFTAAAIFTSFYRIVSLAFPALFILSSPAIVTGDRQQIFGQGLVLLSAVCFYAAWATFRRQRFFAYIASGLSILPFTAFMLLLPGISAKMLLLAWVGWAGILLLVGFLLDRSAAEPLRLAHGPTFAGYALALATLLASIPDRWLNIVVLGVCILLSILSALLVHFKSHRSFDDFVNFFLRTDSLLKRGVRLLFLFFAVYTLPVWVMQLEAYNAMSIARQGLSLALLAPLYIAAGLFLRRYNRDATWPLYSAGYALTVLGALVAFNERGIGIDVLALDVAVYTLSAVVFRQPFWLYLATFLAPVTALLALDFNGHFTSQWIAWTLTAFGLLYFGLGQLIDWRKTTPGIGRFALPFYIPSYLLSVIALFIASRDNPLARVIYPANIVLYALSAWRFRKPLFLYPTVWLSILPYFLWFTTIFAIPTEWQGLVWLPLILFFIALGRLVFHRRPINLKTPASVLASLTHPAIPFYLFAYALTVTMMLASRSTPLTLTVSAALATLVYFASALLFRHPAWLYPTLFSAHLAILSYFAIHPPDSPARYITLPFLVLTWLEALAGYFVSRRFPVTETSPAGKIVFKFLGREFDFGSFPSLGFLSIPSWAQPVFIVVALDTLAWESLALTGVDTGVWVSTGFFLLFGLFTLLWQDRLLAHLSLAFGIIAAGYQFHHMGLSIERVYAAQAGLAFGLYLLSLLGRRLRGVFSIWHRPLVNMAVGLSILSLLATLPTLATETISAAIALGFAGALYLTMSLMRRTYLLGYFGMGLLIAAWSLFLFVRNIDQPQVYAIPAGLYFTGIGFLERRRRPGRFAQIIESLGLALLLVTSFIQSLNGETGFPYFLLLLVEGLLVVWWGAARHLRVPFVIGLTASVANVLAQVAVLVRVYDVNRWLILFGVGILLLGLAIFVERRRVQLLSRAQDFRDMLERWA